jgi:hypothetical protein
MCPGTGTTGALSQALRNASTNCCARSCGRLTTTTENLGNFLRARDADWPKSLSRVSKQENPAEAAVSTSRPLLCDFPGFGLHSFRRANITLRQEVGGSAIEASKIAGHSGLAITGEYTKVQLKRQDELTRAIQERIEEARLKQDEKANQEQAAEEAA